MVQAKSVLLAAAAAFGGVPGAFAFVPAAPAAGLAASSGLRMAATGAPLGGITEEAVPTSVPDKVSAANPLRVLIARSVSLFLLPPATTSAALGLAILVAAAVALRVRLPRFPPVAPREPLVEDALRLRVHVLRTNYKELVVQRARIIITAVARDARRSSARRRPVRQRALPKQAEEALEEVLEGVVRPGPRGA